MRSATLISIIAVILSACGISGSGAAVVTPLHDVQGSGNVSPMDGQSVTVRGIVTGDFQNGDANPQNDLGGFYLQEENSDEDPATSNGVFVFDGSSPNVDVNVGDRVTVDGAVNEYLGETQISATRVEVTLAGAGGIAETDVILPVTETVANSDGELIADLEQFEGMLVRFPQTLTVTHLRDLERYGEILLSQNGRHFIFTNDNAPDVAGYAAHLHELATRSILLDDGLSIQGTGPIRYLTPASSSPALYPAIRIGDTTTNLTGNIRFSGGSDESGFGAYRLVPTSEPSFVSVNVRPKKSPTVGGTLTLASVNLDNYFMTLAPGRNICGPSGDGRCRGANNQEEFERQSEKIITTLSLLNADIIGLTEIENDVSESLQTLVDELNAVVGADHYAFVDTGTIGPDAIKVGFLYKVASVSTIGQFAVINAEVDPRFDSSRNRPSLAQSFSQKSNGAILTIVVSHFKSKSSSCAGTGDPDRNDGQSDCNVTRTEAAAALVDWLATDPTGSGDPDILIIGDLNAHMLEDPVTRIEAAGYENLLEYFIGTDSYSYLFEGQSGVLDHVLASPSLASQVTGVAEWHINADEAPVHDYGLEFGRDPGIFDGSTPYRFSDHDPVVIGLDLTNSLEKIGEW